jgi:cytoskeletal protein CcmA (bactofilin family)
MGFFKKSVSVEPKRTALTIISRDNKISGNMTITGKLHVDGNIEGRISSIEDVSIGRTGFVKGYIKAKNITVSGLLEGEVHCDYLHILSGGRVVASVSSLELITDSHSQFIGERRESHSSISDKAAQQAQIANDIDLDIIDNLPNKITLDHPAKKNDKPSEKKDDKSLLQEPEAEQRDEKLLPDDEVAASTNSDQEEKHSLDDLGVLSYMEGLEFLDELDAQCETQKEAPQSDAALIEENCLNEEIEPESESVDLGNPTIASIARIISEEELSNPEEVSEIEQPEDNEISAHTSEETDKITKRKSELTNSKKIDENTTKLELKF